MIPLSLLPQDTRIAEVLSGLALVFVGVGLMIPGNGMISPSITAPVAAFWALITLAFGALQLSAIAMCKAMEHLRFILAWISGSFWIWVATSNISYTVTASEVATIVLGITNLYAFIINLLLVKQSWK
jgi:hypothetical protein